MRSGSFRYHLKSSLAACFILAVMVVYASVMSDTFTKANNIGNILVQTTPLAIAAIGQTIVILAGTMDFSVGSIVSFSTVIVALVSNQFFGSGVAAVLLALLMGLGCGIINGVGVVHFKIPPMIMSFCVMTVVSGISVSLMPGSGGSVPAKAAMFFAMSNGVFSVMALVMFLLYGVMLLVTSSTPFGRRLYAVGNNERHAVESGINAGRVKIQAYALSGLFASVAGILLCYRMFSGSAVIGATYSMETIAAVVLGGASLAGGYGTLAGTLVGAFIYSMIRNMLNMLDVSASYQYIVKGLILVLALLFFQFRRRRA